MKPTRNSGFTLIEVLISFVILALVLGVVFRSLSTGLSHERTAELATARVLEARSILDRLGADLPLEEGLAEGELATGEAWTLTVSPYEVNNNTDKARPEETLKAYLAVITIQGADGRDQTFQTLKLGK